MDATQKGKMKLVAFVHLCLTVFVGWKVITHMAWSGSYEREIWFLAWASFWSAFFFILQPLVIVLFGIGLPLLIPKWLFWSLLVVSIPAWSAAFGWLYTKTIKWLERFSILGKKVF